MPALIRWRSRKSSSRFQEGCTSVARRPIGPAIDGDSNPIGFPPVYFPVEINGREYGQMHVDGGAIANFFLAGFLLDRQRALAPPDLSREDIDVDLYLLVNSHLLPQPEGEPIEPRLLSIAMASSWATSWSAQTNQLVRAYQAVKGVGAGFHLAGIPADYPGALPLASFDPETMTPLFRFGEISAQRDDFWRSEPEGIDWRERL